MSRKREETATEWSLRTWKQRHDVGYFPRSDEHRDWKVFDTVPEWLLSRVRPDDVCLDLGCGYGEWAIPLSPLVRSIMGIDIHESPVEKGLELALTRGIRNVHLKVSDGISVPFPDCTFSFVYSISVFQHLPREMVREYLRETGRVLETNGRCLHMFRNADNVGPFPVPAQDITTNHTGDFSVGWTEKEIRRDAESAGLDVKDVINLGLFLILEATV